MIKNAHQPTMAPMAPKPRSPADQLISTGGTTTNAPNAHYAQAWPSSSLSDLAKLSA